MVNLRDKASRDDLEDQGDPSHQRRDIASNARAHGQEPSEQRHHAEEERDDEEGEREPRCEEVVVRAVEC